MGTAPHRHVPSGNGPVIAPPAAACPPQPRGEGRDEATAVPIAALQTFRGIRGSKLTAATAFPLRRRPWPASAAPEQNKTRNRSKKTLIKWKRSALVLPAPAEEPFPPPSAPPARIRTDLEPHRRLRGSRIPKFRELLAAFRACPLAQGGGGGDEEPLWRQTHCRLWMETVRTEKGTWKRFRWAEPGRGGVCSLLISQLSA